MASKWIFILFFLSFKLAAGYKAHHAGYQTFPGEYYGSQAKISAWGVPDMNPGSHFEVSVILVNFGTNRKSLIKAGFHVYPWLYHNNDLRFFTFHSDDTYRNTGCYNTNCPGFVVANSSIFNPGEVLYPLSQYDGEDRFVTFSIRKDPKTELWTLYREDGGTSLKLGWWKKEVLGDLADHANGVQWGGFVGYYENTGPSMGSGHYPNEGMRKAAYMADLKLFDSSGNAQDSPKIYDLIEEIDNRECYSALPAKNFPAEATDQHKFYYGGPAGCGN